MKLFKFYDILIIILILIVPIFYISARFVGFQTWEGIIAILILYICIFGFIGFPLLIASFSVFLVKNCLKNGYNKTICINYSISIVLTLIAFSTYVTVSITEATNL